MRAAGAVLWRRSAEHGIRLGLVHRPRYDDWSLPKGKADPGETAPVTAAREVLEETGFHCRIGRALTTVSYRVTGREKTVQYFAAEAVGGEFVANREVDRLEWVPLRAAAARLSYDYDRAVVATFEVQPCELTGVLLVRHARAGHRESWDGDDTDRPLDGRGTRQAEALVTELAPFLPARVHTAPVERCRATVAPLADRLGVPVLPEPALAEDAYRDHPAAARRRISELAHETGAPDGPGGPDDGHRGGTLVVCSQGGVIPGVLRSLAARSDVPIAGVSTPKAAYWLLSFDGRRLVQADPYPAPAL
ncbi:NUDIX hydrolase [Nakamurella flavida]|uniref:NUDIX hydrolase n=1 Tax=Nakamurella flavida TaxID=363630 RepID=A0A938YLU5_9ACTN|nr:NUDIX hydrolase [Nakamurella flavida]